MNYVLIECLTIEQFFRRINMKTKYFFIAVCLIFCLALSLTSISAATGINNNVSDLAHDSSLTADSGESNTVFRVKENKNTLEEQNGNISSSKDKKVNIEASSNTKSDKGNGEVVNEQYKGKDIGSDSNAGTFSDLNTLISNTPEGEILNLTQNYTYNSLSDSSYQGGIVISKSITIDGRGFIIDGNNQARIFNITADSINFINLKLTNGNTSSKGGAIYWFGSDGTVTNCTFTNNNASDGGAIYWINGENGIITNSTFTNNNARNNAGAIYWNGANGTITNSTFTNNNASDGGAIYWNSANGTVTNSTFTNNNATDNGGAIYWTSGVNGTVTNCTFTNNTAKKKNGGAISWMYSNYGKVTNCTFTNNSATSYYGGAISWNGVNGTVTNCTFTNNTAFNSGGAIYWPSGVNGTVTNCTFTNNNASYGGAIYWSSAVNGTVTNCTFTNNTATGYYGGAISWNGVNGTVTNCTLTNNNATTNGGAIYWNGANGAITNCTFTQNTAKTNGGAIYWYAKNGALTNCTFTSNNATTNGGAIYWNGTNGTISNCTFTSNNATTNGGAIYWFNINGTVTNSTFTNNKASYGGAIYWNYANGTVTNSIFTNNIGNNGGAIYWNYANGTVTNSIFTNNTGEYGGTIYWNAANGTISNCTFTNNNGRSGGAIYWDNAEDGTISNCTFTNNTGEYGGAIYWSCAVNGTVTNCTFTNNKASYGGAIYWSSGVNGTISNCIFTNNNATNDGGAIIWSGANGATTNCIFTNNNGRSGGAIYWDNAEDGKIINSTFENNTGNYRNIYNNNIVANITNCTFKDVYAFFDKKNYTYGSLNYLNATINYGVSNYTFNTTVKISFNGETPKEYDLTESKFSINLSDFSPKEYEFLLNFTDLNNNNYISNNPGIFNISRFEINFTDINNITVVYGANNTVDITGSFATVEYGSNYTGPITIRIGDITAEATVSEGKFSATLTGLGILNATEHMILITGQNNTNFTVNEYHGLYNVTKAIIDVTSFDNITVTYGANDTVIIEGDISTVEYGSNYTGAMTVSIGSLSAVCDVSNGHFNTTLTGLGALEAGEYDLDIRGDNTADFDFNNYTGLYNVTKASADIGNITADTIHYGDGSVNITGSIISNIIYGNNYTGNITLSIKGYDAKVTLKVNPDGSYLATMTSLPKLAVGKYTIIVSLLGDDGNYNATSKEFTDNLTVLMKDVNITLTGSAVKYGSAALVKNNAPSDITAMVTYTITGNGFKKTVQQSANEILKLIKLPVDTYTVTASCSDPNYNMTFNTAKVIVQNTGASIKAGNMKRAYNSGIDYKASLLNLDGQALSNVKVTVKVAGKTYSVKTDSKGVFTLNKKFKVGSYKIQITNPSTKESVSRTFNIVKRLTNNRNLATDFSRTATFKIRAIADDGSVEKAGKIVVIKVHGVSYKCKTNAKGIAQCKISLNPGTYKILSSYKGYTVKNTYKVRHILKAVTKSVYVPKSASRFTVKAQVKYSNGKALKSRKVQFVFNHRKFISKTNSKGIATFVIGKDVIRKLHRQRTYTGKFMYLITVKSSKYGKYATDTVAIKVKT